MSEFDKRQATREKSHVIPVSDLLKQIEQLADIRRRVRDGYYNRTEVLARIARRIREPIKE
ncbi:MAG: hypothetical protein PHI18_04935 [bacterium]|nr:hypothetical protein [bacterium]